MREKKENYEILSTNLEPFFWRKKLAFQEFLLKSQDLIAIIESEKNFEAKIENLQPQVTSLD